MLYGENGSGKTSVLESIHILASGRSFRTSKPDTLINNEETTSVVFAELTNGHQIGLSRTRRQGHQLNMDNEKQRNWDKVARELPVQVLDANSFLLVEGGPKARRRFLDWGVFHMEPQFVEYWRKSRKCIAHRNFLLKQARADSDQLGAWDIELCLAAREVDKARSRYFMQFLPIFEQVFRSLADPIGDQLSLTYSRGWDSDRDLAEMLAENRQIDYKYGATQSGPHRADIFIRAGNRLAIEILSRGQQKTLVSALKIAQGMLLTRTLDRHCIYLVDDLPAEFDRGNRERVLSQLVGLGGQLFVTCVDQETPQLSLQNSPEAATFHVERGTITA